MFIRDDTIQFKQVDVLVVFSFKEGLPNWSEPSWLIFYNEKPNVYYAATLADKEGACCIISLDASFRKTIVFTGSGVIIPDNVNLDGTNGVFRPWLVEPTALLSSLRWVVFREPNAPHTNPQVRLDTAASAYDLVQNLNIIGPDISIVRFGPAMRTKPDLPPQIPSPGTWYSQISFKTNPKMSERSRSLVLNSI